MSIGSSASPRPSGRVAAESSASSAVGSSAALLAREEQKSDRWCRTLVEIFDDGIYAALSDTAARVLNAFLRLNDVATGTLDPASGRVEASISRLASLSGRRSSAVYDGIGELLDHPRRLLAKVDAEHYIVLPGWKWAGRRADSPPSASLTGSANPQRPSAVAERSSVTAEQSSAAADPASALRAEFKTSQPENNSNQYRPEPGRNDARALLAGCSDRESNRTDGGTDSVRSALIRLRLRDPLLSKVLALKGLTAREVQGVQAQVCKDETVTNPAVIVARRLFESRGLTPPASRGNGLARLLQVQAAGLERIRIAHVGGPERGPVSSPRDSGGRSRSDRDQGTQR